MGPEGLLRNALSFTLHKITSKHHVSFKLRCLACVAWCHSCTGEFPGEFPRHVQLGHMLSSPARSFVCAIGALLDSELSMLQAAHM